MVTIRRIEPLYMSDDDNDAFANAIVCHFCEDALMDGDKLRNHCHLTGKSLGAAHNMCNLNYKMPDHIPVFFQNLRSYDCNHLICSLGKYNNKIISSIATTYPSRTALALRKNVSVSQWIAGHPC